MTSLLIDFYNGALGLLRSLASWVRVVFGTAKFVNILVQFCTEVGVLIFVFPSLEKIVAGKPISAHWALGSLGLALLFLVLAGIISAAVHD